MKIIQKGFTLVELVIIIALLGIMAAIVGPRLVDSTAFSQKANKDKTLFLLKTAQKIALTQRRDVYVLSNDGKLSLCYVNTNPCPTNQTVLFQNKSYSIDISNSTIVLPSLKFNSKGNTDNVMVTIKIDDKNIYIEEDTGYIHE